MDNITQNLLKNTLQNLKKINKKGYHFLRNQLW